MFREWAQRQIFPSVLSRGVPYSCAETRPCVVLRAVGPAAQLDACSKTQVWFYCPSHAIFSSIRELSTQMKHCKHHSASQKSASQQKPLTTLQMLPKQHLCFWVWPWKMSRNYVQLTVRQGKQPFWVIKFILIFLPLPSFHLYSGVKENNKMIEYTSFFQLFCC